MGKVDRLCKRVEPFAALFGLLAMYASQHCPPAWYHNTAVYSQSIYGQSWFNSQRRRAAPLFLSRYVTYLWVLYTMGVDIL